MAAAEQLGHPLAVQIRKIEQKIVRRLCSGGDLRTEIVAVEKRVQPHHRQEEGQRRQPQKTGNGEDHEKQQQRQSPLHIPLVHLPASGEAGGDEKKQSVFGCHE